MGTGGCRRWSLGRGRGRERGNQTLQTLAHVKASHASPRPLIFAAIYNLHQPSHTISSIFINIRDSAPLGFQAARNPPLIPTSSGILSSSENNFYHFCFFLVTKKTTRPSNCNSPIATRLFSWPTLDRQRAATKKSPTFIYPVVDCILDSKTLTSSSLLQQTILIESIHCFH